MSLDTAAAVAKLRSLTGKFDNSVKATNAFLLSHLLGHSK
jgi:hypothetical protein